MIILIWYIFSGKEQQLARDPAQRSMRANRIACALSIEMAVEFAIFVKLIGLF